MSEERFEQRRLVRPPGATEILLVRHGASADAMRGVDFPILDGHGDPPLSPRGHEQAQLLAARLATIEPRPTALYVSGLTRTLETAAPITEALGLEPVEIKDLREVRLGEWEGGVFRIKVSDGDPLALRLFAEERWDLIPGAESMEALAARTLKAVERIVDEVGPDATAIAVAHGGIIGELCRQATQSRPFAFIGCDNTSITRLWIVPQYGRWVLGSFNDSAHLDGVIAHTNAADAT
jgi:2,3-bisphosphoglycerate-dependent phosphoglycerate mutase